eukprot:3936147-Rhodomonas_salina.2
MQAHVVGAYSRRIGPPTFHLSSSARFACSAVSISAISSWSQHTLCQYLRSDVRTRASTAMEIRGAVSVSDSTGTATERRVGP